jgi:hypothetical protein
MLVKPCGSTQRSRRGRAAIAENVTPVPVTIRTSIDRFVGLDVELGAPTDAPLFSQDPGYGHSGLGSLRR